MFETLPGVERALHILKPYKLVAREWHKASTVVRVRGIPIGGSAVQMIAGPCSVETDAADACRGCSGRCRRCAPHARRRIQAAHEPVRVPGQRVSKDCELLKDAAARHGLPIVTELMDVRMLDTFLREDVDVIQIGTRNMQNFDLLKEVGRVDVPVILKRGMSATISDG